MLAVVVRVQRAQALGRVGDRVVLAAVRLAGVEQPQLVPEHDLLLALDEATVQLSISSNGPTIPDDVERYLFEPFFSTRSRGTGLGTGQGRAATTQTTGPQGRGTGTHQPGTAYTEGRDRVPPTQARAPAPRVST